MSRPTRTPDRATQYARSVTRGGIIAGPHVRQACQRHLDDVARWGTRPSAAPFYFDAATAAKAIRFFERELVLADVVDEDGEIQPFLLQPWQAFIIGSLFGWKKAGDLRRFRTAYMEVGKGNGKSPLAAAIGLYCLIGDDERYPEVYSAAVSTGQAKIIWTDAERMVQHGPRIGRRVALSAHVLLDQVNGGKFQAVSSEARTLQGKRPHCVLIDEVHEHPDPRVVSTMRRGTKGRRQALIIETTNSGFDRSSICYKHHTYSRRILDGTAVNETWFSYVCGLDASDDWRDPDVWIKANPNIGVSIQREYLEEAVAEALGMPSEEASVRRLNFCEWVGRSSNFIPAALWGAGALPVPPDVSSLTPHGGLDLGMTDDMTALSLVWRLGPEAYYARTWYWVAGSVLTKYPDLPWAVWEEAGHVRIFHGSDVTDFTLVTEDVTRIAREYGCRSIAFDKQFAQQMAQGLMGEGIQMIDQRQGFGLNEAMLKLGALLKAGGLTHDGSPISAQQAGHLISVAGPRGEIRPFRESGSEKIDGMVALIMALGRAMLGQAASAAESEDYEMESAEW